MGVVVLGDGEVRITGPRGGTCLVRWGSCRTGVAGIFGRLDFGVEGPDLDVEGPACDLELTLLRAKSEHKSNEYYILKRVTAIDAHPELVSAKRLLTL